MTDSQAWSQEAPADLKTVLDAIITASSVSETVFDGLAVPGAKPPFVTMWQLDPQQTGVGLAAENWGIAHAQWQISAHGATQGQARYMAEQITGSTLWPSGWELVEVGPLINDTTDKPETWFWPVTFVYRGMAPPTPPVVSYITSVAGDGLTSVAGDLLTTA